MLVFRLTSQIWKALACRWRDQTLWCWHSGPITISERPADNVSRRSILCNISVSISHLAIACMIMCTRTRRRNCKFQSFAERCAPVHFMSQANAGDSCRVVFNLTYTCMLRDWRKPSGDSSAVAIAAAWWLSWRFKFFFSAGSLIQNSWSALVQCQSQISYLFDSYYIYMKLRILALTYSYDI